MADPRCGWAPMTPSPLGPGAEFDLIRRLTAGIDDAPPGVELGSGDDGAVLEGGWVVSVDLAVEGVHFRREWLERAPHSYADLAARVRELDTRSPAWPARWVCSSRWREPVPTTTTEPSKPWGVEDGRRPRRAVPRSSVAT